MTKIIIVGSGGLAADITTCFDKSSTREYKDISVEGYIDWASAVDKKWKRYNFAKPVINDIDNYKINQDEYYVLGMSDIKFRRYVVNKVKEKGGRFLNLIHPSAIIAGNSDMGTGNVIFPFCYVGPNAHLGDFNNLNIFTMIGHDCNVGNNNLIASSKIAGEVSIGDDNFFGIMSTVIPLKKIGSRNIIQAGMIIDKDVPSGSVIFHRFKEKVITVQREEL